MRLPVGPVAGIMEPMTQAVSFYEAVGGEPTFRRLGAGFYRRAAADPVLRPVYPAEVRPGAEDRLRRFLMRYWGGRHTYGDRRGDAALRMRHAPFAIGPAERGAWLRHMTAAVEDLELPEELAAPLLEYLTMAATAMRNRA